MFLNPDQGETFNVLCRIQEIRGMDLELLSWQVMLDFGPPQTLRGGTRCVPSNHIDRKDDSPGSIPSKAHGGSMKA